MGGVRRLVTERKVAILFMGRVVIGGKGIEDVFSKDF